MIPLIRPMFEYPNPPDMGGLRANTPIVSQDIPYALSHSLKMSWYGPGADLWTSDNWPRYNGDVWTIQLSARPAYYIDPELAILYGLDDANMDDFAPQG